MRQILKNLQKNKEKEIQKMKENPQISSMEENPMEIHNSLLEQKQRIERKIKRFEKSQIDNQLFLAIRSLKEVNESLSDIQNALNIAWKRTQQIEENLNKTISMFY